VADCTEYASIVRDALDQAGDDIVLVGHSLAGLTIPLVATVAPVRLLVFVCALLPEPGRSLLEQNECEEILSDGYQARIIIDESGNTSWRDESSAIEFLYHDCDPGVARDAASKLRPQSRAPHRQPCPLDEWPRCDVGYVLCKDDRIVRPAWSREAAPRRLGARPIELAGGHSPMLSRPETLATMLLGLSTGDGQFGARIGTPMGEC
jgi:pimeloyl-ACP methyl ester carboxylesterase